MRASVAALLIFIGAVLTFPASLAVWEQRVIADRDGFVELGQEILRNDAVQDRLTERILADTTTVLEANGLFITSGIIGGLGRVQAESLTRVIVEELSDSLIGVQALETAHRALMVVIDDKSDTLGVSGDAIFMNFRPVIERVIAAFETFLPGGRQVVLPQGIGEVVIVEEEDVAFAFEAARLFDGYAWFIAVTPLAFFAAALVIASNRRMALVLIGIGVVLAAGLRILIYYGPLRSVVLDKVVDDPALRPAAEGIYDTVASSLVSQEIIVVVAGLVILVAGILLAAAQRSDAY